MVPIKSDIACMVFGEKNEDTDDDAAKNIGSDDGATTIISSSVSPLLSGILVVGVKGTGAGGGVPAFGPLPPDDECNGGGVPPGGDDGLCEGGGSGCGAGGGAGGVGRGGIEIPVLVEKNAPDEYCEILSRANAV